MDTAKKQQGYTSASAMLPRAPAPARPAQRKSRPPVEGLFCNYSHRICMQNRLEGYDYCARHILEDKSSPYRQCTYVAQSGKRCPNANAKADKRNDGQCTLHAGRQAALKQKALRKRRPKETPETLLEELEHYAPPPPNPRDNNHHHGPELKRMRSIESVASKALEYGTSSESEEEEPQLVDQAWRGDGDSDAESADSEQEDVLKHAGVYTSEEVALITRDKLIRLQSLYIDQFKRLQHLLKEKRRRFLHTARAERERFGSLSYAKEDPEQREKYDTLKCMKHYHRRYGREALLQRQSKERRIQVSEGLHYRPPSYTKCVHSHATGAKCGDRTVPLSKHCKKHIIFDPHQVLYKPCGFGAGACQRPVPALAPDRRCFTHAHLHPVSPRLPAKQAQAKGEEEEEECVDVTTVEVKPELGEQEVTLGLEGEPIPATAAAGSAEPPPTPQMPGPDPAQKGVTL